MPSDATKGATEGLERRISSMDENKFHENEKSRKRINDTRKLARLSYVLHDKKVGQKF